MTPDEQDIAFTVEGVEGVVAAFALQPNAAPDSFAFAIEFEQVRRGRAVVAALCAPREYRAGER